MPASARRGRPPGRRRGSPGGVPARSRSGRASGRGPGCRRGPSSSASCLTSIASPGRSPLEAASPPIGDLTEVDSTQAMARSVAGRRARRRAGHPQGGEEDRREGVAATAPSVVPQHRAGRRSAHADQGAVQPAEGRPGPARRRASAVPGSARSAARATRAGRAPSSATTSVEHLAAAGDQDHPGPLGHQLGRAGPAQPAAGGGDHEDPVGQSQIHGPILAHAGPDAGSRQPARPAPWPRGCAAPPAPAGHRG